MLSGCQGIAQESQPNLGQFRTNGVISPLEIQQRLAAADHDVLDFRNEDGMVARHPRVLKSALEVRQRSVQHRSPMGSAIEPRSRVLGTQLLAVRIGIVFRYCLLALIEDIYPEALARVQVGVGLRLVIHANQHQQGINGNRGERIRGHAVNLSLVVQSQQRHAGGKRGHCPSKLFLGCAHQFVQ